MTVHNLHALASCILLHQSEVPSLGPFCLVLLFQRLVLEMSKILARQSTCFLQLFLTLSFACKCVMNLVLG